MDPAIPNPAPRAPQASRMRARAGAGPAPGPGRRGLIPCCAVLLVHGLDFWPGARPGDTSARSTVPARRLQASRHHRCAWTLWRRAPALLWASESTRRRADADAGETSDCRLAGSHLSGAWAPHLDPLGALCRMEGSAPVSRAPARSMMNEPRGGAGRSFTPSPLGPGSPSPQSSTGLARPQRRAPAGG